MFKSLLNISKGVLAPKPVALAVEVAQAVTTPIFELVEEVEEAVEEIVITDVDITVE